MDGHCMGRGRVWPRALLGLLLLCCALRALALGNPEALALIAEASSLQAQGKIGEAQAKLLAAQKADPASSAPLSAQASLLWSILPAISDPQQAGQVREEALRLAARALQLNPRDPVALEVQRAALDRSLSPLHSANAEAARLLNEGEHHFHAGRYDAALQAYRTAFAADPKFSVALVMAGDCFYVRQRWGEAEALFRQATELEPLNGQAWRFLADALFMQKRGEEGVEALLSGIAAHPSQMPSWLKLSNLSKGVLPRLAPLNLMQKAQARVGQDGKPSITIDQSVQDKPAEMAFWLAYAVAQIADEKVALPDGPGPGTGQQQPAPAERKTVDGKGADEAGQGSTAHPLAAMAATPFQRHLLGIRMALAVIKDEAAVDPALLRLKALNEAGELEAALLLLTYRESFRPELEAWKRRNPDGVRKFLLRFAMRP